MLQVGGRKPKNIDFRKKTVKCMLSLTPEVRKRIGEEAEKLFGNRQGNISMYCEMVFRNHLSMSQPGVDEN